MQKSQPNKHFSFPVLPVSPVVFLFLLTICTTASWAEMFKWVDEDGVTHYGDKPPEDTPTMEIKGSISSYTKTEVEPLSDDFFDHLKDKKAPSKRVVMYSAEWCGICKKAANYFDKNDIAYTEYDIDNTEKGKRDFEKLNGRGVPIILVGQQRMNGFSAGRFESMYY